MLTKPTQAIQVDDRYFKPKRVATFWLLSSFLLISSQDCTVIVHWWHSSDNSYIQVVLVINLQSAINEAS